MLIAVNPQSVIARCVCVLQDHPDSAGQIAKFIETYGVNVDEVELPVRTSTRAPRSQRSTGRSFTLFARYFAGDG